MNAADPADIFRRIVTAECRAQETGTIRNQEDLVNYAARPAHCVL
jgi:hypothetical protein